MDDPLLDMAGHDVDDILHQVAARLAGRFRGVFSAETWSGASSSPTWTCSGGPASAGTCRHLPALAENFASERLTALAQVKGRIGKPVPEVLYLCAYNAGRSQLAAALTDRYAHGRVHVRCAGSHPADWLDLNVLEALGVWDIEVEQAYPKPLTDDVLHAADVIVTMGCGDACPILSGKRYLDWQIPDPAGQDLPVVRAIRDDIDARVRALVDDLLITTRSET
jgi:arsenate reductase (thioredoxin)